MSQVFISYSRKDITFVQDLADDLRNAGMEVWWDLSGTAGGEDWVRKIGDALKQSQYMLIVLTPDSVQSQWVLKEYLAAVDGRLKIIPLLYKACETPWFLHDLQRIDALDGKYPACLPEILNAVGVKTKQKFGGKPHLEFSGLQFIKIPAGKFLMGSQEDNPLAHNNEKPQHTLELPDYWMAKFPLTNEQYAAWVGLERHPLKGWEKKKDHPVVKVSWKDATGYCKWLNQQNKLELQQSGLTLHVPTEAQWEKAARGDCGNEWPWGNQFDLLNCNSSEGEKRDTTPVSLYPRGESPYGVADMIGNVWEWTLTLFKSYPYQAEDGRESEMDPGSRVLRGGSFRNDYRSARCAYRNSLDPEDRFNSVGFRVCASPLSSNSA